MNLQSVANDMQDFAFDPADLAPGDSKSGSFDLTGLRFHRVRSSFDPLFTIAYAQLWDQFGESNELETVDVLDRRLAWKGAADSEGIAMRYDLVLVLRGDEFVAVRDHTAVADRDGVVVHLSHVLIAPDFRRSGLAGWLRALPLQTARHCLAEAELPSAAPITLVAEMEYPDGLDPLRGIRLMAYERAGFKKVNPRLVRYRQPDFRPFAEIDESGGPTPLDFQLIVRRVDRELDEAITGGEVRRIVDRLYRLYGRAFRPKDMQVVWDDLRSYPPAEARIDLIAPTA